MKEEMTADARSSFLCSGVDEYTNAIRNAKGDWKAQQDPRAILYFLTRFYALSAAASRQDERLPQEARGQIAERYMLRALDLLAPEDREIIRLVKLQGQSAGEVGQLLGKSPNAVRIQLCRALKELHAHLKDVHATLSGSVPPARPGP